ncbi:MAG TPA: hypothetical protein P5532_15875, partial [Planctomycetota bacterium]|nr:hypothetical protein [Planctomycetota bacterium]
YQGSDCVLGEFVYGGGLAGAADARLGTVVPRAATMDPAEVHERRVHVWNPTPETIESEVIAVWPDGSQSARRVAAGARSVVRLVLTP